MRNARRWVLRLASYVVCSVVVFCRRWVGSWVARRLRRPPCLRGRVRRVERVFTGEKVGTFV